MSRIRIDDLPKEKKIRKELMKKIFGGPNRREHDHIGQFTIKIEPDSSLSDPNKLDLEYLK